jgi:hypothetical protein
VSAALAEHASFSVDRRSKYYAGNGNAGMGS